MSAEYEYHRHAARSLRAHAMSHAADARAAAVNPSLNADERVAAIEHALRLARSYRAMARKRAALAKSARDDADRARHRERSFDEYRR